MLQTFRTLLLCCGGLHLAAGATTCSDVKLAYREQECCGAAAKTFDVDKFCDDAAVMYNRVTLPRHYRKHFVSSKYAQFPISRLYPPYHSYTQCDSITKFNKDNVTTFDVDSEGRLSLASTKMIRSYNIRDNTIATERQYYDPPRVVTPSWWLRPAGTDSDGNPFGWWMENNLGNPLRVAGFNYSVDLVRCASAYTEYHLSPSGTSFVYDKHYEGCTFPAGLSVFQEILLKEVGGLASKSQDPYAQWIVDNHFTQYDDGSGLFSSYEEMRRVMGSVGTLHMTSDTSWKYNNRYGSGPTPPEFASACTMPGDDALSHIPSCQSVCPAAFPPTPFSIGLKWVPQAQFAGYYVALDNGYYLDEHLNVTIVPGGMGISQMYNLLEGTVDAAVEWVGAALQKKDEIVHVSQTFSRSGLLLVCHKDAGIQTPADLANKTVGIWFGGNEYPFLTWMNTLNMTWYVESSYKPYDYNVHERTDEAVKIVKQGWTLTPFLSGETDCASAMSYNEYLGVLDAVPESNLTVFNYEDEGVSLLEDGLYVAADKMDEAGFADEAARFLRATMRGWAWAQLYPEAAVELILKHDDSGTMNRTFQLRQMAEVNKLVSTTNGALDMTAYQRSLDMMNVTAPSEFVTHAITEAAFG